MDAFSGTVYASGSKSVLSSGHVPSSGVAYDSERTLEAVCVPALLGGFAPGANVATAWTQFTPTRHN
jgi:hypothetical protein